MAISNDDQAEEEHDDVIFTPELSKMLKKAKGEHVSDDEMIDEETGEKAVDNYPDAFDDSEEEKEDYTIRKTDSIVVAATAENDHCNLEVYIYEHESANLFVHHEIILASYPLCMEWAGNH